jgi:hypothetical protein
MWKKKLAPIALVAVMAVAIATAITGLVLIGCYAEEPDGTDAIDTSDTPEETVPQVEVTFDASGGYPSLELVTLNQYGSFNTCGLTFPAAPKKYIDDENINPKRTLAGIEASLAETFEGW